MIISGLQKLTLLDFPGYVACTLFTRGCNFRCPFCQNSGLVLPEQFRDEEIIQTDQILEFLKTRKNRLQGVCITGGEPTLQADLPDFIETIRNLGYKVKLDTNGTNPAMLKKLLEANSLDYIAMDIKTDMNHYNVMTGCITDVDAIQESIELIKSTNIEYEFRTTVIEEHHSETIFKNIGRMLKHATNYSLQYYEESEHVIAPVFTTPTDEQMFDYAKILSEYVDNVVIKGK